MMRSASQAAPFYRRILIRHGIVAALTRDVFENSTLGRHGIKHRWILRVDGRNISGRGFRIGKRETLVLDDVVGLLTPWATSAVGAIRIDSDHAHTNDDFIVSSRTYTGREMPAVPGPAASSFPLWKPRTRRDPPRCSTSRARRRCARTST